MLFKGGVLSSMGWQHHPPRHAAARAALGVQAAHAILGMAPPHMPPSSPRHANAKRARPRHRGEPSHATAVTPCPVHAAPRTRPMPPMRTRPPPHATSALPAHSAPSLPVSARPLERACCLGNEPCLYRSYEGFTRCSRVLVRSRLRTSRGSTRDAVS